MSSLPLHSRSLTELATLLRRREISPVELTRQHLDRIRALDPRLHAYAEVFEQEALARARASELRLLSGLPAGPLEGLPIALKDLADVEGRRTMAGSTLYAQRAPAQRTSTVAARLLAAGAVLLGKAHLVELAFGGWGTNQGMGTPRNPWDMDVHRSPGGSSSGSAVAVAGGLAAGAIGTDTGGSVRIPSAFCGLTGLKTTQGRISNHGFDLVSHTLDTVGPMTWTAEDAALILQAIHGPDPADRATLGVPPEDFLSSLGQSVAGTRIAVAPPERLGPVEPDILQGMADAVAVLGRLGCLRHDAAFADVDFVSEQEEAGVIIATESFAGHGHLLVPGAPRGDEASRARVLRGRDIPAARYAAALQNRDARRLAFAEVFRQTDVLVLPTLPIAAAPVDALDEQDLSPSRLTRFVGYFGLCAIALPCGVTRDGLPMSLQLVAGPHQEKRLLELGAAFQRETGFHTLRPALG